MKNTEKTSQLDVAAVRERLATTNGRQYWRSLEEASESEEFREFLDREFPRFASEMRDPASRRAFLKLMGASLALAGLSGCQFALRQPPEKIVPYVRQPEQLIPGKPLFFATTRPAASGFGIGLLVESNEGRPTKIEGNPDHPASLGSTDALTQASILTMYDPDRSQVVLNAGNKSDWAAFNAALGPALANLRGSGGAGLRILSEGMPSPTLISQIDTLLQQFPQARWDQYEPLNRDNAYEGARQAFGRAVETVYHFDQAVVVVSLDADFLSTLTPGSVRYARDFSQQRRVRSNKTEMNRLYVVESTPSITGAMADHRLPLRSVDVAAFAQALAQSLGVGGITAPALGAEEQRFVEAVTRDLQGHRGASIVIAGDNQPPAVHALVHAINSALENVGKTVSYTEPVERQGANQVQALRTLAGEMDAGQVQVLVILGGNPVYTAPADLDFAARLARVPLSIHWSLYVDETSAKSTWHIPATHFLETWSDARAFDGTASIIQPLIAPLYDGKSAHELISALLGQPDRTSNEIVRAYWQGQLTGGNFEQAWQRALHDGVVANSALPAVQVTLQQGAVQAATGEAAQGIEIVFRPDYSTWDGSFANNGWMQEIPRPLTKIVWDNPAEISPALAQQLGLANGDLIDIKVGGRQLQVPVWITPGHANNSITLRLGYGRERAGIVGGKDGKTVGFNTYALRTADAPWIVTGAQVTKAGGRYQLVTTQEHFTLQGTNGLDRPNLLRVAPIEQFKEDPQIIHEMGHPAQESLYPPYPYEGHRWAMSIDLNTCIGCNACTVACQAENNIPIVGKDQVSRGREMHWIRVDRYYAGNPDNPQSYQQPVPCMQCENAPCEVVCPVGATVHDGEGLNTMVYNRCVGTKYCSNNCPYKVRRFNFYQYADQTTPVIQLQRNPNVSVRARGVMEKCTYCVQRIAAARQQALVEHRELREDEVLTACQQACPTQAIVFGDLNAQGSRVAALRAEPQNYGMLEDIATQPRTTYLAKFTNPNPDLETE